jgi:monoamine oxidase
MARTPLFGLLQRSLSQAQRSLRTGEPVLEILDKSKERRAVSRRDFLIATAAAAATASCRTAIPPALQIPMGTEHPRVAIIGAGIAGLIAGYRLQQAGIPGSGHR